MRLEDTLALLETEFEILPLNFAADFGVHVAGSEHARAAGEREARNAGLRAAVEFVGGGEKAGDYAAQRRGDHGAGEPRVRLDALLRKPLQGQVNSPCPGVFSDIARDVCELHGEPEIAGAGEDSGCPGAHQQGHHDPDGAGYAGRVGVEVIQRLVAAAVHVPCEAFEQSLWQRLGNRITADDIRERALGRDRVRTTVVDAIEPRLKYRQSIRGAAIDIHSVVGKAAERVEAVGGIAQPRWQQQRGGVECARAVADGLAASSPISRGCVISGRRVQHLEPPYRALGPTKGHREDLHRDGCLPPRERGF